MNEPFPSPNHAGPSLNERHTPAQAPTGPHDASKNSSTPQLVDISGVQNVTDLLVNRFKQAPQHIAFEARSHGASLSAPWRQISTSEFMDEVAAAARGLIASGVQAGDRVLIMAQTQYLWAVADHAALFTGAVVVPVYDTASDEQLRAIIIDAQPAAAFAGDDVIARRLAAAATYANGSTVATWVFDYAPHSARTGDVGSMTELAALGTLVTPDELETRRVTAALDDIATIVYTSGTTGTPKGALITHRNLVGQVLNTADAYREVVKESGNTILFLPLTHVLGRALQLICVANGMRVAHLSNPKDVVQALAILQPTFLVVVPRVLEKIQAAAAASARQKKVEPLWSAAVTVAQSWGVHLENLDQHQATRAPIWLRVQRAVFDRLFYKRLRAVMGNRIEYLLSGAATLQPELARFFRGIGVPVIEGYGLTETTAPLTGGRPGSLVAGNVGRPLPGNSVRISENGEVLAQGVGVFAGYRDQAQNAAAFVDGYFRTGDLGKLHADGSLSLHGRLKHVIVTSTGYTVSPEAWEQAVEAHPLVAHATLVGTDRPYLTALLVLDQEATAAWFKSLDMPVPSAVTTADVAVCNDVQLTAELAHAVEAANASVSPSQRVQYWRNISIGEDATDRFVTPTMKLKRQALVAELTPVVDELYR